MRILVIAFIACLKISSIDAQELSIKDLAKKFNIGREAAFVLNGIPYAFSDSVALTHELKKIKAELVVNISVLKKADANLNKDVVIISFAEELSPKLINERYQEIEELFKDKYISFSQHFLVEAKDPVLYIDGEKIHHTETSARFQKLKKNDIGFIDSRLDKQSAEIYGQNAKNGVVTIWTKNGLKKMKN